MTSIAARASNAASSLFGRRKKRAPTAEADHPELSVVLPSQPKPLRHYVRRLIHIRRAFRPPGVRYEKIKDVVLRKTFGQPSTRDEKDVIEKVLSSMPLMMRLHELLVKMQTKATGIASRSTGMLCHAATVRTSGTSSHLSPNASFNLGDNSRDSDMFDGQLVTRIASSSSPKLNFTGILSSSVSGFMPRSLPKKKSPRALDTPPSQSSSCAKAILPQGILVQSIMGLVCECTHLAKVFAVQVCLQEYILPMKHELKDFQIKYDSLKKQFENARMSYLKEVTALRDRLGERPDHRMSVDPGDAHKSFLFDAKDCLGFEEAEFVVAVLKEEMKILFDTDSRLKSKADPSQIERLLAFSASKEEAIHQMELNRRDSQIQDLKRLIVDSCQPEVAAKGKKKGLIEYLEDQIKELQTSNKTCVSEKLDAEEAMQKSQLNYEECKTKYDEVCKRYDMLESEHNTMQDERKKMEQQLSSRVSGLESDLRQSEESYEEFKKQTHTENRKKDAEMRMKIEEFEWKIGNLKTQNQEAEHSLRNVKREAEALGVHADFWEAEAKTRTVVDLSQMDKPAKPVFRRNKPADKNDVYLSTTEEQANGLDEGSAQYRHELELECQQLRERLQISQFGLKMHDELLKQTLHSFDIDKGGFITEAKLKEVLGDSWQSSEAEELMSQFKTRVDGKISSEELLHYLKHPASTVANESAAVTGGTGSAPDCTTSMSSRGPAALSDDSIQALVAGFEVVRENHNLKAADAIREDLKQHGVEVRDEQCCSTTSDGRRDNNNLSANMQAHTKGQGDPVNMGSVACAVPTSPQPKGRADCRDEVTSQSSEGSFGSFGMLEQVEEAITDVGSIPVSPSGGGLSVASSTEEARSEVERLRAISDGFFMSAVSGDVVEEDIPLQAIAAKRKLSVAECVYLTKQVQDACQTWKPPEMTVKVGSQTCSCGATKELQAKNQTIEQQKQMIMELVAALQKATLASEHGQSAAFDLRSQVEAVATSLRKSVLGTSTSVDQTARLHTVVEELDKMQKGAFSRMWDDAVQETVNSSGGDRENKSEELKQGYDRINAILEAAEKNAKSKRSSSKGVNLRQNERKLPMGRQRSTDAGLPSSVSRKAFGVRHNSTECIGSPSMDMAPAMISGKGIGSRQKSTEFVESEPSPKAKPKPKAKATAVRNTNSPLPETPGHRKASAGMCMTSTLSNSSTSGLVGSPVHRKASAGMSMTSSPSNGSTSGLPEIPTHRKASAAVGGGKQSTFAIGGSNMIKR